MALQGTLKDFGLADILQMIGIQQKSGVLTLENDDDVVTVKFLEGKVVGADTARCGLEDLLGSVLVSTGRITDAQLKQALRLQKKTLQRLGHVLVRGGLISEEDLIDALRVQSMQIIFRLFRWREGKYSFSTVDNLEYDEKHFVPISAETILMEGARMVDEWPIIERRIKSDGMILRRTEAAKDLDLSGGSIVDTDIELDFGFGGDSQAAVAVEEKTEKLTLAADEREVMSLVDGSRTAEQINERASLGEFDTYRILADLLTRNLIEEVKRQPAIKSSTGKSKWVDRLTRAALNSFVAMAVLVAIATLSANPMTPWRLQSGDESVRQLRFYASQVRLEQIDKAIQIFYLDAGSFPQNLDKLAMYGYIDSDDLTDPWGRPYAFGTSPGGYQLVGLDADGEAQSELSISHRFSTIQRVMESDALSSDQ
jgi:hypothetical protein